MGCGAGGRQGGGRRAQGQALQGWRRAGSSRLCHVQPFPSPPRAPAPQALPTWPRTSRNEGIINSKRFVTAHFKGACGQQLPPGPGRAAATGYVCLMCLGTETTCVYACAAPAPLCIMHSSCAGHAVAKPRRKGAGCACTRLCPCMNACRRAGSRCQHRHGCARVHTRGTSTRLSLPPQLVLFH